MLLAFINWSQWRLLQGKHVWDSTHFVLALAPRSQRQAGLPKIYVAANELYNKHLRPPMWPAVKIRNKTLLMWVRQEILARHTNQGKGSSNASLCAELITAVLFMANEFCQSLS
jgi:hypothetical protein